MMNSSKLMCLLFGILLICSVGQCFPQYSRNPNLEYELISGGVQTGGKPFSSTTQIPETFRGNTPPPVDPNSKTFAFNAQTKTWTMVKKSDPIPAEDTLLWNQSNDKWLTSS